MHRIAPHRAISQRTASAVLFFLALGMWLLGGGRLWAQEAIYRCGHEYTNAPRDLSRCERLPEQSITMISGVRPHGALPKPAPHRALPSDAQTQPDARTLLAQKRAQEMLRLEKQHQAWAQEISLLLSQTGTAEYGAAPQNQDRLAALHMALERAEREMEALQREWARAPQSALPSALPVASQGATPAVTPVAPPFAKP